MLRTVKKSRAVKAKRKAWRLAKGHTVTRKDEKEILSTAEAIWLDGIRQMIWARSGAKHGLGIFGTCELCGRPMGLLVGEHHHDPSKAATRGLPYQQRHTRPGGCRAHPFCHQQQTENRQYVDFDDPALRFDGAYVVREWETEKPLFRQESRTR